jgi:hypothetical protein
MSYKIHNGTLFDYTAGVYCGVLVKEHVMRKLAALQTKHLEDVKRLLIDQADKGNVFPSSWTLHYPDGKQTKVSFISNLCSVEERINNAVCSAKPKVEPLVFIAETMEEAKAMADARYSEIQMVSP